MKKKLLIAIFLLLLILGVFLYLFFNKGENNSAEKINENDSEVEKLVKISQSDVSSFVFVTQESKTNHILNVYLTPFLTFVIEGKEIKSFNISNFKGTNSTSEVILIPPTDLPLDAEKGTFLFTVQDTIAQDDIKVSSNNIEYTVVPNASKFNEVNSQGIVIPYFGMIVKDIGRVNYKEIVDRDGNFDGSKYLEYSKVPLEALDTKIQFDVNIEFADGEKYSKKFAGTLQGVAFASEASPIITLEVVE